MLYGTVENELLVPTVGSKCAVDELGHGNKHTSSNRALPNGHEELLKLIPRSQVLCSMKRSYVTRRDLRENTVYVMIGSHDAALSGSVYAPLVKGERVAAEDRRTIDSGSRTSKAKSLSQHVRAVAEVEHQAGAPPGKLAPQFQQSSKSAGPGSPHSGHSTSGDGAVRR